MGFNSGFKGLIRTASYQRNCISAIIQATEGRTLVSPAVEENKHHTITFKVPGCKWRHRCLAGFSILRATSRCQIQVL